MRYLASHIEPFSGTLPSRCLRTWILLQIKVSGHKNVEPARAMAAARDARTLRRPLR